MSATKIAKCWQDILGESYQIDHDADEVIWRFENCSVYITECLYGIHEVTLYANGSPIFIIKDQPHRLESLIKAIQK